MINIIKKSIGNNVALGIAIFLISFCSFTATMSFFHTTDSMPTNFVALNIIFHRRLDLQNYYKVMEKKDFLPMTLKNDRGLIFGKYPPILGVLSVPTFWILNNYYGVKYLTEEQIAMTDYSQFIGKLSASFYCSLSAVLMFFILLRFNKKKSLSFFMTLVYFLCTNIFNTASQANFQHSISLFLINSFIWCFLLNPKKSLNIFISGLIAGLFTQLRLSNFLYVFFILVYFIFHKQNIVKKTIIFVSGFAITYLIVLFMNLYFHIPYGYQVEFFYSMQMFTIPRVIENLIALLFSYNYGFFFFSPILLLGFVSFIKIFKDKKNQEEEKIILSFLPTLLFFFACVSSWWVWTGGRSLNSRLLAETAPILIILLNYSYKKFGQFFIYKIIFCVLLIISLFINILTTYFIDRTISWYDYYTLHNKIKLHEYQMRNAWFSKPTFLAYIFNIRRLRIVKFYRQKDKLIDYELIYRLSLKNMTLQKISEKKDVILDLSI